MRPTARPTATLIASLVLGSAVQAQSTWFVDVSGTPPGTGTALDPYTSIDFALAQPSTVSGDLVLVSPGTYHERVTFAGKGVTVMSTDGADSTLIDAGGTGSVVSFLGTDGTTMRLDGFKLTGGTGTLAAGTTVGGGVYGDGAMIEILRCSITANQAGMGGGMYLEDCVTTMRQSRVRTNLALPLTFTPDGGGLYVVGGTTDIKRCSVSENQAGDAIAPGSGGGIRSLGGNAMTLRFCWITDNVGEIAGGGVLGAPFVSKTRFERNVSQFGGGLNGAATVVDSVFFDNHADSSSGSANFGGGVYGQASLTDCTLRLNTAAGEGAAAHGAVLSDCQVDLNQSFAGSFGSTVTGALDGCTVQSSTLLNNAATGDSTTFVWGGGAARSLLIDCDVITNSVSIFGTPAGLTVQGGGVYGGSVIRSRVRGNTSSSHGGGVAGALVHTTEVAQNSAPFGAGCADSDLERATLHANVATGSGAGGLHVTSGSRTVLDSIVWDSAPAIVTEPGAGVTVTYTDVEGGHPGTGNLNADPLFWNEAAGDLHLQALSPCIDAGNPASPLDPDGSRADMGAYPYDPSYSG